MQLQLVVDAEAIACARGESIDEQRVVAAGFRPQRDLASLGALDHQRQLFGSGRPHTEVNTALDQFCADRQSARNARRHVPQVVQCMCHAPTKWLPRGSTYLAGAACVAARCGETRTPWYSRRMRRSFLPIL